MCCASIFELSECYVVAAAPGFQQASWLEVHVPSFQFLFKKNSKKKASVTKSDQNPNSKLCAGDGWETAGLLLRQRSFQILADWEFAWASYQTDEHPSEVHSRCSDVTFLLCAADSDWRLGTDASRLSSTWKSYPRQRHRDQVGRFWLLSPLTCCLYTPFRWASAHSSD